jgi:hypothetical protein
LRGETCDAKHFGISLSDGKKMKEFGVWKTSMVWTSFWRRLRSERRASCQMDACIGVNAGSIMDGASW